MHRISVHHEPRQRWRSIECGEWVSHVLYFHGSIYLRELFASMHASAMAGKKLNCTYEIRRRRRTEKIIREREGEEKAAVQGLYSIGRFLRRTMPSPCTI